MKLLINGCLAALMLLALNSCVPPPKQKHCAKPTNIIAFLDMRSLSKSGEGADEAYLSASKKEVTGHFNDLMDAFENRFLSPEKGILPFSLRVFPLYYNTGSGFSMAFSYGTNKANCCDLGESEVDDIRTRFRPAESFEQFYSKEIAKNNRDARKIWPSINTIAQEIKQAKIDTQNVVIIIFSDFIESAETEAADGFNFLTLPPRVKQRYLLNKESVSAIINDLKNPQTTIGAAVAGSKKIIEANKGRKNIQVFLIPRPEPNLSEQSGELLEYAETLYHAIGLEPVCISMDELAYKLTTNLELE